jgi:hypothetical protein
MAQHAFEADRENLSAYILIIQVIQEYKSFGRRMGDPRVTSFLQRGEMHHT